MSRSKWVIVLILLALVGILMLALQQGWIKFPTFGTSVEIREVLGQVELGCGGAKLEVVTDSTSFSEDCTVATEQLSLARIQLPVDAALIELHQLSALRVRPIVSEQAPAHYSVELQHGIMRTVSETSQQVAASYTVRTPTVAVGIRGTAFVVRHNPQDQRTVVWLEQGLVDVTPVNSALAPVILQPGQKVEVTPDGISPVTAEAPPPMPVYPGPMSAEDQEIASAFVGHWRGEGFRDTSNGKFPPQPTEVWLAIDERDGRIVLLGGDSYMGEIAYPPMDIQLTQEKKLVIKKRQVFSDSEKVLTLEMTVAGDEASGTYLQDGTHLGKYVEWARISFKMRRISRDPCETVTYLEGCSRR